MNDSRPCDDFDEHLADEGESELAELDETRLALKECKEKAKQNGTVKIIFYFFLNVSFVIENLIFGCFR